MARKAGSGKSGSGHCYKILVVDDEPDLEPLMLQYMRRQIRSGVYEFIFAGNGIEALEVLEADKGIDMVLSDINMPKMDGLTLLQRMQDVAPDVRAVIISAYGDMENIRTAMNRGAFDFITKPIDFGDLKITINRTLEHIEKWQEATRARDQLVALENELDVASRIQQSVLPSKFLGSDDYTIFGTMQPARNVGGDFFDLISLPDGRIGLLIADVSGKGVPAALFMMSSRILLKSAARRDVSTSQVLAEVNNVLSEDNEACMFVTMLYAVYDPNSGELQYTDGGHDPPVIVRADGHAGRLPVTEGLALGVISQFEYQQQSYRLSSGDTVILYTDGVTDAMNSEDEILGLDRLLAAFKANPPASAEEAGKRVLALVNDFAGDVPQFDDTTCLILRHA